MKASKIRAIFEVVRLLRKINNSNLFFIFPSYCQGGAEKVHSDILKIFNLYKPNCFITNKPVDDIFKKDFQENSNLIELTSYSKFYTKYQKHFFKYIAKKINSRKKPIIFGCNNPIFYDLIPYLSEKVLVIDLLHAFSYELEHPCEKYSLPYVERINKRVVLGKKTLLDFKELYEKNNINPMLLDRISIIKNKVKISEKYFQKTTAERLKILFVGRNSSEKRPELFFRIATKCNKINLPLDFQVIGDFEIKNSYPTNVEIIGILNQDQIIEYYKNAHIILITSFREGLPMVILEGMAYGVVPISTNVGEIPDFINSDNKNGFCIDNNLEEEVIIREFIQKIQFLIDNPETLKEYSKNAYTTVKKEFSEEAFKKSYTNLFTK